MRKKKASIDDVARRAKVSITTVSRVINNVPTVHPKIQAKVEEAIAYFNYQPDISAQRLARGLNNAVGLVMPGYPGIFHSFYAIEIIRGVGHSCETLRLDLIFHIANAHNELKSNNVGGIIFADIIENRKQVESTLQKNIPCMVINNVVQDLNVNFIAVDNLAGGRMATEYLISLGHKRIATVTGNLQTQGGSERLKGFKEALAKAHIDLNDEYVFEGDYSRRSARLAAEHFLSLEKRPTAIFSASDEMALEMMAVVLERGLRVPADISIIGFDDNPACLYGPVALTTVRQPLFLMAENSVKYLNAIVSGKKKALVKEILTPELVIRDSCGLPK